MLITNMSFFKVNEIFHSIQGEGLLAGIPSVFIRLAGCHLRCQWCDTAYAWKNSSGAKMSPDAILGQISLYNCHYVVITGGEPLIQDGLPELVSLIRNEGFHVTIETAVPRYVDLNCNLISMSPKLLNSNQMHELSDYPVLDLEGIRKYTKSIYQIKCVASGQADAEESLEFLKKLELPDNERAGLMPLAQTREEYNRVAPLIAEICTQYGLRFWPRLHIELWGGKRGK